MNQQQWLETAYEHLREHMLPEAPPLADVLISYGFPKGKRVLGQCWYKHGDWPQFPEDKSAVIFVSPCRWDAVQEVLNTLLHEMIHAAYPDAGHTGEFSKTAKRLGFQKPWTSTPTGEELAAEFSRMATYDLPTMPRAGLLDKPRGSTGSRLRLWECNCEPPIKLRAAKDDLYVLCEECDTHFYKKEQGA